MRRVRCQTGSASRPEGRRRRRQRTSPPDAKHTRTWRPLQPKLPENPKDGPLPPQSSMDKRQLTAANNTFQNPRSVQMFQRVSNHPNHPTYSNQLNTAASKPPRNRYNRRRPPWIHSSGDYHPFPSASRTTSCRTRLSKSNQSFRPKTKMSFKSICR